MSKESIRRSLYILLGVAVAAAVSFYCYKFLEILKNETLAEDGEPLRCDGIYMFNQNNHRRTSIFQKFLPTDKNHFKKCLIMKNREMFLNDNSMIHYTFRRLFNECFVSRIEKK